MGALCIAVAFVCVAIVDHWGSWDPLWLGLKKCIALAKDYRQVLRLLVHELQMIAFLFVEFIKNM